MTYGIKCANTTDIQIHSAISQSLYSTYRVQHEICPTKFVCLLFDFIFIVTDLSWDALSLFVQYKQRIHISKSHISLSGHISRLARWYVICCVNRPKSIVYPDMICFTLQSRNSIVLENSGRTTQTHFIWHLYSHRPPDFVDGHNQNKVNFYSSWNSCLFFKAVGKLIIP